MKRAPASLLGGLLTLALLLSPSPRASSALPAAPSAKWEAYLPVLQDPDRGQDSINTRTIQRRGEVFFFQYRNVISPAFRNRALSAVKPTAAPAERTERLRLRRWASRIGSRDDNAAERPA
ncbi:MAG: hypothetical protein IJ702_01025, partial [Fretibacterium sp.]|nr:hypothetical protein [Fretibacterium sp.]